MTASYKRRKHQVLKAQQFYSPSPLEPREELIVPPVPAVPHVEETPNLVHILERDMDPGSCEDSMESDEEPGEGEEDGARINDDYPPLLKSFQTHVANFIWQGKERDVIKCHCHISKLLAWTVDTNDPNRSWRDFLKKGGLLNVRYTSYKHTNKNLIAAFVERWHPETNSFHFPFGEMTITLDDVYCITGLSVEGLPVQSSRENRPFGSKDVIDLLGVDKKDIKGVVSGIREPSMKLEWLRTTYMEKMNSKNDDDVTYAARAYAIYTFGCSLFADKTGTRVSTSWLEYLEDMERVGNYAWGAATLAFLYRQLGLASRNKVKQIAGYLTLLEAWIYEHFPSLIRPARNMGFNISLNQPLAQKWAPEGNVGPDLNKLQSFREQIDLLQARDVNWMPYTHMRDHYALKEVTFYHGYIVSGDIVEPYMPDRVLRQFGYVQTIPERPLGTRTESGRTTSRKTKQHVWGTLGQYFESWDMHLLSEERLGRQAMPQWECDGDYMTWFVSQSHLFVINPEFGRKREPDPALNVDVWRMNTAAHDMMATMVERWKDGDTLTVDDAMQVMESACQILVGDNGAGPSTSAGRGRHRASRRGR